MCKYPGEQVIDPTTETLDELTRNGMKIIQARQGYRFSMDAVLLAHFAEAREKDQVLDLGCGSGIISILVASREPSAHITGLEIQPDLADRAQRSVQMNGLLSRVEILHGDLRRVEEILGLKRFNLVVANPPFWRQGEGKPNSNQEKLVARHEIYATLADYVEAASRCLNKNGRLAMVQRAARATEMSVLLQEHGFGVTRMRFIHAHINKSANLFLVEATKGSKSEVNILPPFIVYGSDGKYSEEINRIYFED
ncbi:MAG: tRNA1(Val) (adenine(37)-N6)-methyltransferase [Syntrophomonadaceae bacterium]|nr:tRNA1(Val) (adenine(37)-N6)-methyltransferase [Syntrophomonadaceae bacterium]